MSRMNFGEGQRKTEEEEPEQKPEVDVVELTEGPLKGRKYVRLPNGILGPRWYDDILKEKP
jgi:hypothetical protein